MSSARQATTILTPRATRAPANEYAEEENDDNQNENAGTGDEEDEKKQAATPNLSAFCAVSGPRAKIPTNSVAIDPPPRGAAGKDSGAGKGDDDQPADTGTAATAATGPAVQIIDGEIVLQESSLVVTGKRRPVNEIEAEYQHVVEEDTQLAIVNATFNSFKKRNPNARWNVEDTKKFYTALRQLGTDFSAMEAYFEDRSRKQLKKKYMSEQKKNPKLIEMALNPRYRITVDLSVFDLKITKEDVKRVAMEAAQPVKIGEDDDKPVGEGEEDGKKKDASKADGDDKENNEDEYEVVEEDNNDDVNVSKNYDAVFGDEEAPQEEDVWQDEDEAQEEPFPQDAVEPSMDDFFGDAEMDMDNEGAEPALETAAAAPPMLEESPAISLVPMGTSGKKKSKRPKFRSAARKRK